MALDLNHLLRQLADVLHETGDAANSWPVVLDTTAARWQGVVSVDVDPTHQRVLLLGGPAPPPPCET